MNPEQWNQVVEYVEFLEDSLDALEVMERVRAGEETVRDWDEVEAELNALSP